MDEGFVQSSTITTAVSFRLSACLHNYVVRLTDMDFGGKETGNSRSREGCDEGG